MKNTDNILREIELKKIIDKSDGILSVGEQLKEIPFKIKRVYYIYDFTSNKSLRGFHAHKNLEQVIFCLNGSFVLSIDDGINKKEVILNDPNIGIYMGPSLWHTMAKFSKDCIMLVFASEYFDEEDYIRDYNDFLNHVKKQN